MGIEIAAVAGIVMADDQNHSGSLRRVGAAHHSIDVGDGGGLGHAGAGAGSGGLGEGIEVDVEVSATGGGDLLELRLDPMGGGAGAGGRSVAMLERVLRLRNETRVAIVC